MENSIATSTFTDAVMSMSIAMATDAAADAEDITKAWV